MQLGLALGALTAQTRSFLGQLRELDSLRFQECVRLLDQRIGFLIWVACSVRLVSAAAMSLRVTLDQLGDLLRALAVEFDPAAMRGHLAVQTLHFRARVADPRIDFVQLATLGRRARSRSLRSSPESRVRVPRSARSLRGNAPARLPAPASLWREWCVSSTCRSAINV